jgi:hypothetical protein
MNNNVPAVFYLARGIDEDYLSRVRRFVETYRLFPSGTQHAFYVILKGFRSESKKHECLNLFSNMKHKVIETDDDNFDLGAFRAAAEQVENGTVCCLNTNSEIMSGNWLVKFSVQLKEGVGAIGATGSYETLRSAHPSFPSFPNIHLRSNAFLMRREHACRFLQNKIPDKMAAWLAESGTESVSRQLFKLGLTLTVVGKSGRAYGPRDWAKSGTFRQSEQENLLIHDNQTRAYENAHYGDKCFLTKNTWGEYATLAEL